MCCSAHLQLVESCAYSINEYKPKRKNVIPLIDGLPQPKWGGGGVGPSRYSFFFIQQRFLLKIHQYTLPTVHVKVKPSGNTPAIAVNVSKPVSLKIQ